jgi:integrase
MSKQHEIRQKNELVKRKYLEWYRGAEGMSELTIRAVEKAIAKYEDATDFDDFALYSGKKAEIFKKYLATNPGRLSGMPLNLRSRYAYLRHTRNFFAWLAGQAGYKSKIKLSDVQFLQLSKNERKQAIAPAEPRYPTLEQIKTLCEFPIRSEIDQRDRALIAFTTLTGMRDRAIVTLRLGCYDPGERLVKQLPSMGVATKFSKDIYTTLLAIDDDLMRYFTEWYEYLKSERKFGLSDPLFPSTEIGMVSETHRAYAAKGVSRQFWAGAGPMRVIFRERAKQIGLPYFYPHSFRHFVTNMVERYISTPEQMKALSQNLGHENVATTFRAYGTIERQRVGEIVRNIDFGRPVAEKQVSETAKAVLELLKSQGVSIK